MDDRDTVEASADAPRSTGESAPGAAHGWRSFATEIGVVVIGVLLALGAQQAADAWRWRQDVGAGVEALREDARKLVDAAAQREAQSPCLARRFEAIANVLDRASADGQLPAIGQLGAPSVRPWKLRSWDALLASQVTTHLSRERMLSFANLAAMAQGMEARNAEEFRAWTDLYTMVGPGRAFPEAEQAAVRAALSRAVLLAKTQRFTSSGLTYNIIDSGLLSAAEVQAIRRDAAAEYRIDARDGIMCKPLDQAPPAAAYGQAPSPVDLSAPFEPSRLPGPR